jgi:nicotinate phosphoribosyltransferase
VDVDELRECLDYIATLRLSMTDGFYLRGMNVYEKNMFSEDYLGYMRDLQLSGHSVRTVDGEVVVEFTGKWSMITYWETIVMATISELYYRGLMKSMTEQQVHDLYVIADNRLQLNLLRIKRNTTTTLSDFGQRRRNSHLWHDYVVSESKRVLGSQLVGTSDTYFAFKHDLIPIGTYAHEKPMVVTAISLTDDEKRYAQYKVLDQWEELYGQGLRIMLPDTYGSEQFFANAPDWLTSWRGQRQDSGDPKQEAINYMSWLMSKGVDPKDKVTIFSDGLDVDKIESLSEEFSSGHKVTFGWGTLLTNNVQGALPSVEAYRPLSMVVKVVAAKSDCIDWQPCVKLSNNTNKATGTKEAIAEYLRIFGNGGRTSQQVIV